HGQQSVQGAQRGCVAKRQLHPRDVRRRARRDEGQLHAPHLGHPRDLGQAEPDRARRRSRSSARRQHQGDRHGADQDDGLRHQTADRAVRSAQDGRRSEGALRAHALGESDRRGDQSTLTAGRRFSRAGHRGIPDNEPGIPRRLFHSMPTEPPPTRSYTSSYAARLHGATPMSDTSLTDSVTAVLEQQTSRRRFLRDAGVTALVAGVAGACKATPAQRAAPKIATPTAPAIIQAGGVASAASIRAAADAMDAMHEKRMKAFPAKTAGKGCQVLEPRIEKGVKVFELTAKKTQWETEPGMMVEAWAYNGQVPGPRLHVREGDRVRVILHNELPESTSIHFHGLEIPNDQDGVPFITQPPVKPGDSFTYEFTARNAGSHMYHSHHDSTKQVGLGLLGAFIVAPKQPMPLERVDEDFVLILNDGMGGYTLNGKSFPAT